MELADAALEMVHAMREYIPRLTGKSEQRRGYIMYQMRLLDLLEAVLTQRERGGGIPSSILLRSALECLVDCANLSESPHYLLFLRAILLESRYSIFRYKTPPLYEMLAQGRTNGEIREMARKAQEDFRACLKEATRHYPELQGNPRNLSVIMRFRMANMKERYYTVYTWLSMQAHNDLEPVAVDTVMRNGDAALSLAQGAIQESAIIHFALEMLVDSCRYITGLFGPQNELVRQFMDLLEAAREEPA